MTAGRDAIGARLAAIRPSDRPLRWPTNELRPGWFYHAHEESSVRSADELFRVYRSAVGGNACSLLNVPPIPHGLIADPDIAARTELGTLLLKEEISLGQRIEHATIRGRTQGHSQTLAATSCVETNASSRSHPPSSTNSSSTSPLATPNRQLDGTYRSRTGRH